MSFYDDDPAQQGLGRDGRDPYPYLYRSPQSASYPPAQGLGRDPSARGGGSGASISPRAQTFANHIWWMRAHTDYARTYAESLGGPPYHPERTGLARQASLAVDSAERLVELLYLFVRDAQNEDSPGPDFPAWLDEADDIMDRLRALGNDVRVPDPVAQALGALRREARLAAAMLGVALAPNMDAPPPARPSRPSQPTQVDLAEIPTARLTREEAEETLAHLPIVRASGRPHPGQDQEPALAASPAPLWQLEASDRLAPDAYYGALTPAQARDLDWWLDLEVRDGATLGTVVALAMALPLGAPPTPRPRAEPVLMLGVLFHGATHDGFTWRPASAVDATGAVNRASRYWRLRAEEERQRPGVATPRASLLTHLGAALGGTERQRPA